jgi:hypothetical protein
LSDRGAGFGVFDGRHNLLQRVSLKGRCGCSLRCFAVTSLGAS